MEALQPTREERELLAQVLWNYLASFDIEIAHTA
jgi:hypothetical protein